MSEPVTTEQPPLKPVESLEIEKVVTNNETAIEKKEVIPSTPAAGRGECPHDQIYLDVHGCKWFGMTI